MGCVPSFSKSRAYQNLQTNLLIDFFILLLLCCPAWLFILSSLYKFHDCSDLNFMLLFANQVAVGGKYNVLEGLTARIHVLHDAIASDAAQPKMEDIEHAFENFFSSRVIRRMIIDCPAFAVTLWEKALKGKCKIWAEGHRFVLPTDIMLPILLWLNFNHAEHLTDFLLSIVKLQQFNIRFHLLFAVTIYILDVLVISVLRWLQRSSNLQVLRWRTSQNLSCNRWLIPAFWKFQTIKLWRNNLSGPTLLRRSKFKIKKWK